MSEPLRLLAGFALTASSAVAVALLLSRLLRRYASARSAYAAWLVVLLAALIPFRPFAPGAAVTVTAPRAAQTVSQPLAPAPSEAPKAPAVPAQNTPVQPPAGEGLPAQTARTGLTAGQAILALYLAGAAASLTIQLARHIRFMRLARRWRSAPGERTRALFDQACREMGLARPPRLCVCRAADTPMLAGLARPCVLLPDERLNLSELRLIFRHELTHYRRGDLFAKLLTLLAVSLHWYNPLIYLMRREIEFSCEASCDESVVSGQDMDARAYYSETIVAVIRRQSRRRTALATTFYGGKKGMKNRILSIMSTRSRRLGAALLLPVLAFALLFSVALATEPASTNPPQPVTAESLASLFEEEGGLLTAEEAEKAAVAFFCQVREGGAEMARPYAVTGFAIRPVTYGTETFDTAVVDLRVTFVHGETESESTFRAYLTPRGGVPLTLTLVYDSGLETGTYYDHPLLIENSASAALAATLPRAAVVNSPAAPAGNLCSMTTDYEWPMAAYFNGAPVTVDELHLMDNNTPSLTDAHVIYWARVTIGGADGEGGAEGFIPLSVLTFADEAIGALADLPRAAVKTSDPTGHASLYAGCDLNSRVLLTVRAGEAVTLLGRCRAFWHVRLSGGACGFLPLENVAADESALALEAAILPDNFDTIQPGQTVKYEEYIAYIEELLEKYGDTNEWTLEQRAQLSAYQLQYPFDPPRTVDILPGEGDMPQAQAERLAWAFAEKEWGLAEDDVRAVFVYFFYYPDAPGTHLWRFRYGTRPGLRDCAVTLDQQGNAVETFLSEFVNLPEELLYEPDTLDYYREYSRPRKQATEPAELFDRAWELYLEANPEAGDRAEYAVTLETCMDSAPENPVKEGWYRATVHPLSGGEADTFLDYEVYFVGERVFYESAGEYQRRLRERAYLDRLYELEAEMGPFYTWSYQDKGRLAAEIGFDAMFGLPPEGSIPEEEAVAKARACVMERQGFTEDEMEGFSAFTYFALDNEGAWRWRVDFYEAWLMEAAARGEEFLDGYVVWLDPADGHVCEYWTPGGNG